MTKKPKCHNCKYSSPPFKIAKLTHHQCQHPKNDEAFEKGEFTSAWDTLQEWYQTCESHEFKHQ